MTLCTVCLRLREMPAELLRFPVRALKVKAAGFQPPSSRPDCDVLSYAPQWSVEALQHMVEVLHGQVTASVVSREPEPTVLLYDESGELIHRPLVASGLADPDSTALPPPGPTPGLAGSQSGPPRHPQDPPLAWRGPRVDHPGTPRTHPWPGRVPEWTTTPGLAGSQSGPPPLAW
ncbi:RING finger protein 17 [Merluccius polli]|uniref:RING finger protein 17 n=1 Tax=Merluccius polli TaxID=89951 RepID=A0AA47N572_MERPO|nr:RING finger protein 17 [Merluccius polli]